MRARSAPMKLRLSSSLLVAFALAIPLSSVACGDDAKPQPVAPTSSTGTMPPGNPPPTTTGPTAAQNTCTMGGGQCVPFSPTGCPGNNWKADTTACGGAQGVACCMPAAGPGPGPGPTTPPAGGGSGTATPLDANGSAAATQALNLLAKTEAPGMTADGAATAGQFQEG